MITFLNDLLELFLYKLFILLMNIFGGKTRQLDSLEHWNKITKKELAKIRMAQSKQVKFPEHNKSGKKQRKNGR